MIYPFVPYSAIFYKEANKQPVLEFLESLRKGNKQERKLYEKLSAFVALLQEQGLTLPFPYRSHVRGAIHELRARFGKLRGRILFACEHGEIVLLHGIMKNTAVMSERDVSLAEARWKRYKA